MNKVGPNLFIVGVGKAGTYALYEYLGEHPEVFMSPVKEPNFFGRDLLFTKPRISECDYLGLFAKGKGYKYRGEASVTYLMSTSAAGEIKSVVPHARIIIIVRNPVEVLQSRHSQNLFAGVEDIADFERALDAEDERRAGKKIPYGVLIINWLFYRDWVRFTEQILRYFGAFARENVFVGIYDDLKENPGGFYRGILRFLDVDPDHRRAFRGVNPTRRVRSVWVQRMIRGNVRLVRSVAKLVLSRKIRNVFKNKVEGWNVSRVVGGRMASDLEERLRHELTAEVATLSELLGRDLKHWTAVPIRTDSCRVAL